MKLNNRLRDQLLYYLEDRKKIRREVLENIDNPSPEIGFLIRSRVLDYIIDDIINKIKTKKYIPYTSKNKQTLFSRHIINNIDDILAPSKYHNFVIMIVHLFMNEYHVSIIIKSTAEKLVGFIKHNIKFWNLDIDQI